MKASTPAIITMVSALLSACSFNPVGESTFDCNRKENPSEYCRSFKALEKSTTGPLPESRFDKEFKMSDYDRATGIAPDPALRPAKGAAVAISLPHQLAPTRVDAATGRPLRKTPEIQRVWIKRFVDENDSLQDDVIVYREVKSGRWSGFESVGPDLGRTGTYPHRARNSSRQETETDEPPPQAQNLAQPGSSNTGLAGSAMPPAELQSGGTSVPKAER